MENKNNTKYNNIHIEMLYLPNFYKEEKVRIIGHKFYENNKNKCKIIFNGNRIDLKEYLEDIYKDCKNEDKIQIQLEGRNINDISYIFSECKTLHTFKDLCQNKGNIALTNEDKSISKSLDTSENRGSIIYYGCPSSESSILENDDNDENKINYLVNQNINNMSHMFKGCKQLVNIIGIDNWDTSNVKNISSLFRECESLISLPPEISKWNISKVTNIEFLFSGSQKLELLPDESEWDTSNVRI